jgi:hypothetical protein
MVFICSHINKADHFSRSVSSTIQGGHCLLCFSRGDYSQAKLVGILQPVNIQGREKGGWEIVAILTFITA